MDVCKMLNQEWLIIEVRKVRYTDIPNNLKEFEVICSTMFFLFQVTAQFKCNRSVALLNFMIYVIIEYMYQQTLFPIDMQKVKNFVEHIKTVLYECINRESIELIEFFTIMSAVQITHRLTEQKVTKATSNNLQARPLMNYDLDEIENEINEWFHIGLNALEEYWIDKIKPTQAPPSDWLGVIDSLKLYVPRNIIYLHAHGLERLPTGEPTFIAVETTKLIRYQQYQLCPEKEMTENIKMRAVYTLDELSDRWRTNRKNIIKACFESDIFWAYLNITDEMHLHERQLNVAQLGISYDDLKTTYPYSYNGYARLSKIAILRDHIDLMYFYTSSQLKCRHYSPHIISVIPPFSKQILGIYQFIEVRCDIEPTLYFMVDEIHAYERSDAFITKIIPLNKEVKAKKNLINIQNGKLSGAVRKEIKLNNWTRLKPFLLAIAEELFKSKGGKVRANKVANTAVQRKKIDNHQLSDIGKKIRKDNEFNKYVEKPK